jgi:hypothetical protein
VKKLTCGLRELAVFRVELEDIEKRNVVRKALSADMISKTIAEVNRKITASIQSFMVRLFLNLLYVGPELTFLFQVRVATKYRDNCCENLILG